MAKYIKKPIPVEAEPYRKGLEDGFALKFMVKKMKFVSKPYIQTLEGKLTFNEDDYIVTGVKGERYAVRKDIFEETYELLHEN